MSVPQFYKGAYDTLDYSVDWTSELDRIGETIASSFWVIPSATTDAPGNTSIALSDSVQASFGTSPTPQYLQGGTSNTSKTATCFIAGGTVGTSYTIENAIITTGAPPRNYSRQLTIVVKNR